MKVGDSVRNTTNNKLGKIISIIREKDLSLVYMVEYSDGISRFTKEEYMEVV